MEIVKDTLAEAHEAAVRELLMAPEIDIETSPGKWEKTWELPETLMIIVNHPLKEKMISDAVRFPRQGLDSYKDTFTTITPHRADGNHATYTYGNRGCDYPLRKALTTGQVVQGIPEFEAKWVGNGDGQGFNQFDAIIERLKKSPESRRAIMITWVPEIDSFHHEPPCCQNMHFLIRNNLVHGKFLFRSRDGLSAAGENLVAEAFFLEKVTNRLNEECNTHYEVGTLTDISNSFHMYWKRDDQELKEMKKVLRVA